MRLTHAALCAASLTLMSVAYPGDAARAQASHECSGIGEEERAAAESVPHTLRIVYAQADGHFLGGADTVITDAGGTQVLATRCPGPWVLVNLPDGAYKVSATLRGKSVTRSVTISGGRRQKQVIVF